MDKISALVINLLVIIIKLYSLIISPMLGPCCRFYPTCSIYGIQALYSFGILKGSFLLIIRLLKCHPINLGGYDPVPICRNNKHNQ